MVTVLIHLLVQLHYFWMVWDNYNYCKRCGMWWTKNCNAYYYYHCICWNLRSSLQVLHLQECRVRVRYFTAASAANTTGLTYTLDAASLGAGNTINATTGNVTYTATWSGTSVITVSAAGCGGPKTATHTVTINSGTVIKQLYLSDPSQSLDRVDPVNTADLTTASTPLLSTVGTSSTTFTMAPVLCDSLRIKAGNITIRTYVTLSSGTMPVNPSITATLRYGATNIITLSNPTYSGGMLDMDCSSCV